MTREDLLAQLDNFSDEQLAKLVTIGNSILSPLETELTATDFSTMVEEVMKPDGLADTYFPDWTDRSSSDMGRFLVELFALFSDKDFFYMNNFSREGFVGVADLYRSLMHKAVNQGFNPPSNRAASGNVSLVFSAGGAETVQRGSIVLGVQGVPELTYLNKPFSLTTSAVDENIVVEFMHGKLRDETGVLDASTILVSTPKIVSKSIELKIGVNTWTEVDSFLDSTSTDKHFMVVYDEDGRAEILFGADGYGKKPTLGQSYSVEYITGGGYLGDIGDGLVTQIVTNNTLRSINSFEQFAMTGGTDQLEKEELRQVIIGKARHQNRAVTPEDVDNHLKELTFVKRSHSEAFLDDVYVYVMPEGGGTLDPSQETLVRNKIEDKIALGFDLTVSSPVYVPITLEIDLYLLPQTVKSGAYSRAIKVVEDNLNPDLRHGFGEGVNRSTLSSKLLQKVQGATNVVFKELYRTGVYTEVNDLQFLTQELVDWDNSVVTINTIGGV
jgi:hypothetical protein